MSTECYDCIYASFDRVTDELYCTKKRDEFSSAPNGMKRECFLSYDDANRPAVKNTLVSHDFDELVRAIRELTAAVNKAAVGWSEKK